MLKLDQLIVQFDKGPRRLAPARTLRDYPDEKSGTRAMRKSVMPARADAHQSCWRNLCPGTVPRQALTARNPATREAATAGCMGRNRASGVDRAPVPRRAGQAQGACSTRCGIPARWRWGVAAGLVGDKWNLGFLETEKQVCQHLDEHLERSCRHRTARAAQSPGADAR